MGPSTLGWLQSLFGGSAPAGGGSGANPVDPMAANPAPGVAQPPAVGAPMNIVPPDAQPQQQGQFGGMGGNSQLNQQLLQGILKGMNPTPTQFAPIQFPQPKYGMLNMGA